MNYCAGDGGACWMTTGRTRLRIFLGLALAARARALAEDGTPPDRRAAEAFFEARVRPVLAERCWKCHGEAKQSSGLRLDSRAALLEGGGEGPAIVPGKPDESPLVRAIRHEGEV